MGPAVSQYAALTTTTTLVHLLALGWTGACIPVRPEGHLDKWLRQRITGFEMESFMKMVAERQGAVPIKTLRKISEFLVAVDSKICRCTD